MSDGKLAPEWSTSKGEKSTGSITVSPDGVLIQAEPRMHALFMRPNQLVGSDRQPLSASVLLRSQPGNEGPTLPGLYLYWDNYNYLSIRGNGDGHLFWTVMLRGAVVREQPFYNVMPEVHSTDAKKWRESFLRILLLSHNAAFYMSSDGMNWRKLGEAGCRPGPAGKAPAKVILGRGWVGEKEGRTELRNDYYPDGSKHLIKVLFSDFVLSDAVPLVGDLPGFTRRDTWEKTLAAFEADGVPSSWSFLGPVSGKDLQSRKLLSPDTSDDWTSPIKDPTGNVIKIASWTAPRAAPGAEGGDAKDEEAPDAYVDLSEHLGQASQCVAWAKTEMHWPVSGQALLWFGGADPITLYVNNRLVHADQDDWQDRRALRDRYCVPVALCGGHNTVKVRYRQNRGEWGFYLRLERNDPAYRARLLEKLLEAFPDRETAPALPYANWRATQARHEIIRCYETLGDFRAALAAADRAIAAFVRDDENRVQAFESKLRLLEFLRDADGLCKAGDDYLAAYPGALGVSSAVRAVLRGEVFAGRADAAQARAKGFASRLPDPQAVARAFRDLATAFRECGDSERHLWTLDELSAQQNAAPVDRAQAAIEGAVCRWALERDKHPQPPDAARLALACRSAANALALLPGAKDPMAALLAQEADADLKAAKAERSIAGYWGALLLALCSSDPDTASYLGFSKAHKIPLPKNKDPQKPFEDPVQFRKALWKNVGAALGDPTWLGKWRFVGFSLDPTASIRTPLEPERDSGKADYGQGRRWQDLDLDQDPFPDVFRGNHDLGIDLRRWSGNAQVGYVTRDFDIPAPAGGLPDPAAGPPLTLRIAASASWFAWVDGQPVAENTNTTGFRFENDRIPLPQNLAPGKHRLLLKLETPIEGPFAFRVRLSREPELAAQLLVLALTNREFPRNVADRRQDLLWLCNFMLATGFLAKGGPNDVPYSLANATSLLFADQTSARLESVAWACERMRETGDSQQIIASLRSIIALQETAPWYVERSRHLGDLSIRLFNALVAEGQPAAADAVLRDFCNRHPDSGDCLYQALTLRGSLRRDLGQNLGAVPLYERVVREYPWAWRSLRPAPLGLDWARTYRPERLLFDTSYEAQVILDAIRRQLAAGGSEDVERAMRNVSDILAASPGALSRIVDSPYYARFVGVREYIRALLASLPEAPRDVYRKVVEVPANRRLINAAALNDVAALEALANEFYFTPAADAARNRVGNLYLDRGQSAQASSMFQLLLKQYALNGTSGPAAPQSAPSAAMLYAKLARALLKDGQAVAAEAAIEKLRSECAAANVVVGGETMSGMRLTERLKQELAQAKLALGREQAASASAATATHLANLARTGASPGPGPVPGPVVWAHPLVPQATMTAPPTPFDVPVRSHVPAFPVVAEGRVFVTGFESVRAVELASGRILWTKTWGAGGPFLKGSYNGYPLHCPTVQGGHVYLRALESGVSSLRCYAAETGQLRWSTAAAPELRKLVWISDPAVAYNMLFAVFLEPGDLNTHGVAAVDEATGRLRWKSNLVTGATGIRVADRYYLSTLHLGPPAVDAGELYVSTGLASVAGLNAFSGEIKWVATYPRLHIAEPRSGQSSAGYDLRLNSCKAFARGPLSPVLADDLVLIAPKDSGGLLAFDRQNGAIRWQAELADCRYLAGVADGNLLVCDHGVSAVSCASGRTIWKYDLQDNFLYGQPTLSGGLLYLPTEKQLQRVDARTGRLVGATPWDQRLGPLANLAVLPDVLVGVSEGAIAALGPPDARPAALPLYEARDLEAAGRLDAAAAAYEKLRSSKDTGEVLHALTARTRILEKLGKREMALAALQQFERDAPETLSSFSGLWQIQRDVFAHSLRSRLEQAATAGGAAPLPNLGTVLAFAWHLPGDNCALLDAPGGPPDRCFAQLGGDILCLRADPVPGPLWRNYVGPAVSRFALGASLIAAVTDNRIAVFDRATGENVAELLAPTVVGKERRRVEAQRFEDLAVADNVVVAVTGAAMYAWGLPDGKLLWWKQLANPRAVPGGLAAAGGRLFRVQGVKDQRRNESILDVYDLKSGNELQSLPLGARGAAMLASFSPSAQRLLYRAERNVLCADLAQMKQLWRAELPRLEARRYLFDFEDDLIRYYGVENGRWHMLWLNPDTGKEVRPRIQGFAFRMNGEYVVFSGDWLRTLTRQRAQGDKVDKVWEISLAPEPVYKDHYLLAAFPGQGRFHLLYARIRNQDQFVLRSFNWENGQLLGDQVLPGTPVRQDDNTPSASCAQRGNVLIYTAREGLFAYAGVDEQVSKVVAHLRADLSKPDLPPKLRRSARRAWLDLEPVACMAFLAPAETRIDGDLSEWQGTEPIVLRGPLHYVPLGDADASPGQAGHTGAWGGDDDLSANVYLGWNCDGLALAVDVTDDCLVGPHPGMELTSGDSIRVIVDSRSEPGSTLDRGEDFVGSLAWGQAGVNLELGAVEEAGSEPQARVVRAPNGKGYRYELLIPWALIRRDPAQRPGWSREMRLGVAIYDNDGDGVKGALELGAGTTMPVSPGASAPACVPQWLCHLTLLDVSHEKVERYRQVINLVPDADEVVRFLELILLSKRGDKADAERAAELESFISAHLSCRNALRALGLLRAVYKRRFGAEARPRLEEFLRRAKAPPHLQQAITGAALKFWVLPDAKNPPQLIMVQFFPNADWNNAFRAYWGSVAGTACAPWGQDGTKALLRMGDLPRAGEWTELSVSPLDLGLEGCDIRELGFTTFGGIAHFDRAAVVAGGQEKVLVDDTWPQHFQMRQGNLKLVDQPRHDGAKSFTHDNLDKGPVLHTAHLLLSNSAPFVSFAGMFPAAQPVKADPAAQQELFRKVAYIIPDTPEGYSFLQRTLDLHTGDAKVKTQRCIDELKAFLKANPATANGVAILKTLYSLLANAGEANPLAVCETLLLDCRIPRDVRRAFFNEFAPVWSEWQVLGPFSAQGERRGMDTILGPERGVDLNWKTDNASGIEIGWKKITNRLTADKKPNSDPFVDLRRHLAVPKAVEQKGPYFGYAYAKFSVPTKRRALLLFGAHSILSIWLNGKRVVNELETQPQKDKEAVEVQLRGGENEILIKAGVAREQRLGFVFRLADVDGRPFPDVKNE